jgi:signal transduction histidine kinase
MKTASDKLRFPRFTHREKDSPESPPALDWEKHVARLHTLQEISRKLNSKLELQDTLASILDESIGATGAERGCLMLADSATGGLKMCLSRQLDRADLPGQSFSPSQTVISRVWHKGTPLLTQNALKDPELATSDSVIAHSLRSILCVPLHIQGETIGVLYLENHLKTNQFQQDDLSLATAIADQAAIALHNAQLHQEAVDRAQKLMEVLQRVQSLNQVGLKVQGLSSYSQLFGIIGQELKEFGSPCVIALLSPDGMHLEVHCPSPDEMPHSDTPDAEIEPPAISINETGVCRQVLETRTGCFVPTANLHPAMSRLLRRPEHLECQSAFVAPMIANNQVSGLLVWGLNGTHLKDAALFMAFANQIASLVEMCRLYGELQQRLVEVQGVLAITRALVSELSLDNLLEFIMAQAEHLTNAEGAAVLLSSDDGEQLEVAPPSKTWLHTTAIGSVLPVQGSLAGLAITDQRSQISNCAQDDERATSMRALLRPITLRSLLCAPLVVHGKSLGVLTVWNKRQQGFSAHDDRLMSLFADQAALALHNAQLHAQSNRLAIEQERQRLAREIHDSMGQSLYSIALAAQTSLRLLNEPQAGGRVGDCIEYILSLSKTTLAETREQLYNLQPTALSDAGLAQALAQHCETLGERYSLTIDFTACQEPSLSICQQEALYRIAREALWNVIKHADATHVAVWLTAENGQAILSVKDNGAGFDQSVFSEGEMMGLRNMEERAKLLGGAFHLQSRPGQGTQITVQIPIQQ